MNILDSCTFYEVDQTKLNSEQLRNFVGDSLDEGSLILSLEQIKNADIPEEAIDWESGGFDREELNYILTDKIGRLPHYLVIACSCRWNGASGYMFTDEITKTCERSYDISLDLVEEGKNAIKCRESSHDVPMGGTTYIIGLTEEEFELLEEKELYKLIEIAEARF